jgi:lipopolysaccharide export system permease protein
MLALFAFLALIDQLEETGRGNYDVITAIKYVFLILPRITFELVPIAAVMGSMTTLGILAHNSELVIIRVSGMSLFRLGYAIVKGGLIIIVFAVVLGEFIAPYCEQTAQHMRSVALKTGSGLVTVPALSTYRKYFPAIRLKIFISTNLIKRIDCVSALTQNAQNI